MTQLLFEEPPMTDLTRRTWCAGATAGAARELAEMKGSGFVAEALARQQTEGAAVAPRSM